MFLKMKIHALDKTNKIHTNSITNSNNMFESCNMYLLMRLIVNDMHHWINLFMYTVYYGLHNESLVVKLLKILRKVLV